MNAPTVGAIDLEQPPVLAYLCADLRDAAEGGDDQAGHGLVVSGKVGVERLLELFDTKHAADHITVLPEGHNRRLGVLVLVGDIADDVLDNVFDGDDAGRTAVFVDYDRHLHVLGLEFAKELADLFRPGDEIGRPRQLAHRPGLVIHDELEHFFDVNDTGDGIYALVYIAVRWYF